MNGFIIINYKKRKIKGVDVLKKVLIIADPGVDDAFAIMYALLHPEIEILGIVCEYGNVSQDIALKNTTYLLDLAGRNDIPLILGAESPLTASSPEFFYNIHGLHGLGDLVPAIEIPEYIHPFKMVYQLIEEHEGDLTIINLSRLTSLALTFIQAETNIEQVKQILVMGGAFFVPGNRTPVAEANIYGDPQAAKIIATYGGQVTFVPLNISNRAVISPEVTKKIVAQNDTPFSKIIQPIMNYYSKQYETLLPSINGAPLHDVTLFSYLMKPDLFHVVDRQVLITTDGHSKGLTYADFRPNPEYIENYPIHQIIIDFNIEAFIDDFIEIMSTTS